MYDMLKNIEPPLGFGNKCPYRLAYKKLIRMNMPVDVDGKVAFTTTLFALIRENLDIKMRLGMKYTYCRHVRISINGNFSILANEMNQADEELRVTISQIWPLQANKMLDLLVPPIHQLNKNNLTVGKIYGGLLVLETWRNTKFIELRNAKEQVRPHF